MSTVRYQVSDAVLCPLSLVCLQTFTRGSVNVPVFSRNRSPNEKIWLLSVNRKFSREGLNKVSIKLFVNGCRGTEKEAERFHCVSAADENAVDRQHNRRIYLDRPHYARPPTDRDRHYRWIVVFWEHALMTVPPWLLCEFTTSHLLCCMPHHGSGINFLILSVNLIPVPLSLTSLLMLLPHLLTLSTYHSHHP